MDTPTAKLPTEEIQTLSSQAGVVGFFTFLSRLFGLARDTFIAYLLGTKEAADAFYVAFRIPNLLRRLLAEGCLTLSFIPVFTESLRKDSAEAKRVADLTFTLLSLFLLVLTLTGVLGAAFFVKLTAFGFTEHPEKFQLTVLLTRITFPYIFLVSLGALAMGILNSLKSFWAPAASPILLNVGILLGAVFLKDYTPNPAQALAMGVIVGGILQVALQVPPLVRRGFLPKFSWDPKHPGVQKILRLMLPSIYGSAVYQLNLFAITLMGSFLPTGAVSYLWYADRVMEFPLGVFAISFATVILPRLSDHAADRDLRRFKESFKTGLKMVWFINLPATVGLIVLSQAIITVLFEHGEFSSTSTERTAQALQCFALGLPFVSASRITASAFYALQDAKTPVRAANWAVFVNIAMGALLISSLGHRGLALGVALGSFFNFLIQLKDLRKKIGLLGLRETVLDLFKMLCASALMALILLGLQTLLAKVLIPSLTVEIFTLLALVSSGALFYFVCSFFLGIPEAALFLQAFRRKILRL